jgi:arylsulfatase A-like enzyme
MIRLSLLAISFSLLGFSIPCSAANRRPNVILIMADDLGYHDLSCYGHPQIKTPVLDKLAADGIRLTNFHSGATVCTPSRMALLTGAYPSRLGWTKGVIGYLTSNKQGLSPDALTIAEIFKSQGYATGISGKWHVGSLPEFLPLRQGFDFSYFIKESNNQSNSLWNGETMIEKSFKNRLLTEKFTTEAIRFITTNKDKPFFLYLPYTAPHFPVEPHPDWKGKSAFGAEEKDRKKQDYGDVVEELDARIGQVLETLKSEKLDQNTIVVFLSDNGPQEGQQSQATPYRGKKWGSLEGGTRVPGIITWPGVIPARQVSDNLIAAIDLLPSLCQACGIDLKNITKGSPVIDGVNVWETLLGKKNQPNPRSDLLYWHGKTGFHAIQAGHWKLFLNPVGTELPSENKGPALFNLADDVVEMTDVSAKYPEKVRELEALAKKRIDDINQRIIPLGGQP